MWENQSEVKSRLVFIFADGIKTISAVCLELPVQEEQRTKSGQDMASMATDTQKTTVSKKSRWLVSNCLLLAGCCVLMLLS